jgi:hypothetical protein
MQILIGIRSAQKNSDSILAKNWPRNNLDAEYDTYEKNKKNLQQGNGPKLWMMLTWKWTKSST